MSATKNQSITASHPSHSPKKTLQMGAIFALFLVACQPPLYEKFPKNRAVTPYYTIEAHAYPIQYSLDLASHNFWVLRGKKGELIAELHGLSTDRKDGYSGPVGSDPQRYSLRMHHLVYSRDLYDQLKAQGAIAPVMEQTKMPDTLYLKYSPSNLQRKDGKRVRCFQGSEEEALARWMSAVKSMQIINRANYDYPPYGFDLTTPTHNSNSAYRTFGEIMGLSIYRFKGMIQPGIESRLLTPSQIEHYRDKRYPILSQCDVITHQVITELLPSPTLITERSQEN